MPDYEAMRDMAPAISGHEDHPWSVVVGCVYCAPCDIRLYRGRIPDGHPVKEREPRMHTPQATRDMRSRWGKD